MSDGRAHGLSYAGFPVTRTFVFTSLPAGWRSSRVSPRCWNTRPGTITQRRTRCGRPNCSCHADPPRLHDPYWQWTREVAAKTSCRRLSADQHDDYQAWIDNDRRLRELLARLETLGAAALEADPRWERQAAKTSADTQRLTHGQPSRQAPFAQASLKREHVSR